MSTFWPGLITRKRGAKRVTAPGGENAERKFIITHPFHPLYGREFEIITYKNNWGEDRVSFYDQNDKLTSIPAQWTDVPPEDLFVKISAGRSLFRAEDLISLCRLIENLKGESKPEEQLLCVK